MNYIIKDEELIIQHSPGKGAWTYHLIIPNTKDLKGKWGDIKVSGLIDNFNLKRRNLAPTKGADKILSINDIIRKAIGKGGGDAVTVTLYLDADSKLENQTHILECFRDADVLKKFESLDTDQQETILGSILSLPNEDKQVEKILHYIDKLS